MIVSKHRLLLILIFLITVVVVAVIEDDNINISCKPEDARISSEGPICLSCESCSNEMMCCKEISCTCGSECEQQNGSCDHLFSDGMVWHIPEYFKCDTTSCVPPTTVCCPPECNAYHFDTNLCTLCNYHDVCPVPSITEPPIYSNSLNQSQPEDGNDGDENSGKNNDSNNTNVIDNTTTIPIAVSNKNDNNQQQGTFSFMSATGVRADGRSGGFVAGIVILVLLLHVVLATVLFLVLSARFKNLRTRAIAAIKHPKEKEETEATAGVSPVVITEANSPNENNRGGNGLQNLSKILIGVYAALILLSWIFVVAATSSCQFLLVGLKGNSKSKSHLYSNNNIQINNNDAMDRIGTGLFNFENEEGECDRYPKYFKDELMDPPLKAARFFSILSCLLLSTAIIFMVLILLSLLIKRWKNLINIQRCAMIQIITLYCSTWSTIFMFFASGSDLCHTIMDIGNGHEIKINCSLGAVGKLTIITVLVLIATTVIGSFLFFFTKPGALFSNDDDASSESSQNVNQIVVDEEEATTERKNKDKSLASSPSLPGQVVWLKQPDEDNDFIVKKESIDSSDNSTLSTK